MSTLTEASSEKLVGISSLNLSSTDGISQYDLKNILTKLRQASLEFSRAVLDSKSFGDISGNFAVFQDLTVLQQARKLASQSDAYKKEIVNVFRDGMSRLYETSGVLNTALGKPYGYPGDFSILEAVYDEKPLYSSTSASGSLIDRWFLNCELARAVVARKDTLRVFIERLCHDYLNTEKIKLLSIASGSARELRDLSANAIKKLDVILLDLDGHSLRFADAFFKSRPFDSSIKTIEGDATIDSINQEIKQNGPYDFIYSFGLFDYLDDQTLLNSIKAATVNLKKGGLFAFCLKDARYYDPWFYDWFMDWRFKSRIKEDGIALCNDSGLKLKQIMMTEGRVVNIYLASKI